MNSTRDFHISYSKDNPNLTKQIDVIAIDDEVCLIVECKESERMNSTTSWKTTLESINGYKNGVRNELNTKFKDRKIVYIFATKNYIIGDQDKSRMNDFQIIDFDYDSVLYYKQLVAHLGSAARYQFLASIFANQKIKGMDNRVPAIQGKMGGLKYYSFSIEPEKLLKIAYVLHRNNANRENMPTYQRIIKKERLKSVRDYINNGGFFPNSLIIAIDTKSKPLRFDLANNQVENSISKLGVLYLPNTYQSAYIIDGQHRLYGYSDSDYSTNNSIPVVAFENLDKSAQVKMFMDINENQKAVSKSLRNTLNIDMWWNSKKFSERNAALMLDIAQKLGEDKRSALYERVVTGENTTTTLRCITLEYIKDAFTKTSFFSEYKKNNDLNKLGTFSKEDNNKTEEAFMPFIKYYFKLIEDNCGDEWYKGSDGYLAINNTVFALIKILDDITNLYLQKENLQVVANYLDVFNSMQSMFCKLINVLNELPLEKRNEIKNAKGSSAKNVSWRILQVALNSKDPNFINDDLKKYIKENCTDYESIIKKPIIEIKASFLSIVKNKFEKYNDWKSELIDPDLRKNLYMRCASVAFERHIDAKKIDEWEVIEFDDFRKMIEFEKNWTNCFQQEFNKNANEKIIKADVINDLKELDIINNKIKKRNAKVTSNDYYTIKNIIKKYNLNTNLEEI